jgi:hypothetical protein
MKLPQKIPTLMALFLLTVIVIGVSAVANTITKTTAQASASIKPSGVRVTNITDKGFTVTWITADPATGSITASDGKHTQTYSDDRDKSGKMGKYITHSITVREATPNTTHQVKLLTNGKTVLKDGKPFVVTTAAETDPIQSGYEPTFGTVTTNGDTPATGMLVYVTLEGSQELSTLVGPTGSWLVSLNMIRTQDFSQRLKSTDRIDEQIRITNGKDEATAVTDTLNDSPVPNMTVGKTYDFRKQQAGLPSKSMGSLTDATSNKPAVLGQQTEKTSGKTYPVTITQPDDGASLISNLPLFTGRGIPNKIVTLTIGIKKPITASVSVGPDGIWKYTQPTPLGVGKQSITASTVDSNNKQIAITHVFDVLKSGTQVLGIATPSGTLTPPPIQTITPTTILTATPTIASTLSAQPQPETGSTLPTVMLLFLGVGLLIGGFSLGFR